ncbi:MAG: ABC transporter substrate-binding protein [Acidobacteriota bacterium]|nr:ABC transporter substrate-binding protein [Acidobacteriota bacterium]MDH3784666.1 ABC transporter substrate-binding protein [Acidobacteriota bacterium]
MTETALKTARVGHSPDPDDAFMFYGIAAELVDTEGFQIEQILEDIESLNRRALVGELEVTAVSIHAYAHLTDRYALMPCGASMGDGYGPSIVARKEMDTDTLRKSKIAIPGTLTSAYLALQLYLGKDLDVEVVPFDEILNHVESGKADAGLVIHEGQLTYASQGLTQLVDLGVWWQDRTDGLPLPLGGNVVLKSLGKDAMASLTRVIAASIAYGLDHRQPALDYAARFGRGLDEALTDQFVGMYVNDLTRDYGDRGRKAIERLLSEGVEMGLVPQIDGLEFVDPSR